MEETYNQIKGLFQCVTMCVKVRMRVNVGQYGTMCTNISCCVVQDSNCGGSNINLSIMCIDGYSGRV